MKSKIFAFKKIKMKNMSKIKRSIYYLAIIMTAVVLSSCREKGCTDPKAVNYDTHAKKDDHTCQYKGTVTFWSHGSGMSIMVYDGHNSTGTITTSYISTPGCGANGCFTLSIDPNTTGTHYDYDILVNSNYNGSGSFTVGSGACVLVEVQ